MTTAPGPVPSVAELPEPVRTRIVALSAEVLPQVPELPATLRRIAAFAPARRARAGGTAITAALEAEPDAEEGLRERLAVQLRSSRPRYAADRLPSGADPAEAAAFAWLVRPVGWTEQLDEALRGLQTRTRVADQDVTRLQRRVDQLEQELREARERRRTDLEAARQENLLLRRRLGEARAGGREALAGVEETLAVAEAARTEAEATVAGQARELRQLRARVAQLEAEAGDERRAARSEREEATLRSRLLLDTIIDAASGLRRELALPQASGTPGESVEATYAEAPPGPAGRSRTVASLGELEGYLAMPRARLVIDGYNVTKQAWPASALDAQRIRLMQALAPLVARTGAETTVVFDAAAVPGAAARHLAGAPRGVRVVFSPAGVIADDVIRELVAAEPPGRVVLVVSDDQAVARDIALSGGRPVPTPVLLQALR
ncbi:NYN domain-containing protein [Nocardioides sp. BP30]|uniref:NYN domain-containing protein n=1 Tax=Nocardioides sp. BP30 TaxID=3036374 RepID=UPI00246862CB|nr:NYN domain-containing protein [Nocardioides sp. BP30]WGL53799.1 NYN domain-containing protein [Nocardioides sp. BP30]